MTLTIAEKFIFARIEMAKFLHTELEPTLEIILGNLIDDAFLFGSRELGQLVDGTRQFERTLKPYLNYRKQRTKIVRNTGRPKDAKEELHFEDGEMLRKKVLSAMQKVGVKGKIVKRDVLLNLSAFGNSSNGYQKLDRELRKYGFNYNEILEEYSTKFNKQLP